MENYKAYSVLGFAKKNGAVDVEVAPTRWINHDQQKCYWPKRNISILVKDPTSEPDDSWPTYNISRVFGRFGKLVAELIDCLFVGQTD